MKKRNWMYPVLGGLMVLTLSFQANATETSLTYNLGEMEQVKKDTGYSEVIELDIDDAHYGWVLGQFYAEGFTQKTEDSYGNPVFLKNVGDTVQLNFTLFQDINQLNESEKLRIDVDEKGYSAYFQTEPTDFGQGTLIIQHTDYQNQAGDPIIYTDFLSGIAQNANTTVELLEEGDYMATLYYRVGDYPLETNDIPFVSDDFSHPLWFVTQTDHRISFQFSVRNGNCMVFPCDVSTGRELTESSVTENGFYLDLAKSRYLDINVKKEMLSESADGLVEDTRFNRPAKDGEQFTDEGIYTITAKNLYTNDITTKKIYVGTNDLLLAYMVTGLSIQEIATQVELGAVIEADGSITAAPVELLVTDLSVKDAPVVLEEDTGDAPSADDAIGSLPIIMGIVVIAGVGGYIVIRRTQKKTGD